MTTNAEKLADFIRQNRGLTVLSGAGCSTESGIPEYRDDNGNWKHRQPMQYADFVGSQAKRRRYWAQSFSGWQRIATAKPNAAHSAIAELERLAYVSSVITQNVDNLHREAGSRNVIDLHGVLQQVRCLQCGEVNSRQKLQNRLEQVNSQWSATVSQIAPDGDANISRDNLDSFVVPDCLNCGGILKPDVVFFGEAVPTQRLSDAKSNLSQSSALLVVGSSLMVFSGYRFARMANDNSKPIAIVNRGVTRADDIATQKFAGNCAQLLHEAWRLLTR